MSERADWFAERPDPYDPGDQEPDELLAKPLGPDPWGDVGPIHHPTRFDLPMSAEPPF